jgi:hypothetical protein
MNLKTLFFIGALFMTSVAIAQDKSSEQATPSAKKSTVRTKFGPEAGVNFANYKVKIPGLGSDNADRKIGFRAGFLVDVSINGHYHIQPGVGIATMGSQISDDSSKNVTNLVYIQVPLNFVYTLKENHGLFFGAGIYYGYAIAGNYKVTDKKKDETEKTSITFGDSGDFKHGDFGATILAGYQLKGGFFVKAYFMPGLSNISALPIATAKNSAFGVSIGFIPN